MMKKEILDLFKVMVVDRVGTDLYISSENGWVTDFIPTREQLEVLNSAYTPIMVSTLFSVEERKNSSVDELLMKQVLHYVEVYGFGEPGMFNLEVPGGKIVKMNYIRGVTIDELQDMIRRLIYANAPLADAKVVVDIIRIYGLDFSLSLVKNNESRILLHDVSDQCFNNGDDAVRYLVYKATGDTLLIKSPEVIATVKEHYRYNNITKFLESHVGVLSQVFNRHKKLILAVKNKSNSTIINRISRLSKVRHVPVKQSISKNFISMVLSGEIGVTEGIRHLNLRDKFKILNLLQYRICGFDNAAYIVRNGKIHIDSGQNKYDPFVIEKIYSAVLDSVKGDLEHLDGKKILLDKSVDYGLPISRKQTMGNLPFGTSVDVEGDKISSGIFWKNEWGASDLDLSVINMRGERVGWGQMSGYNSNDIEFSGDMTYADGDGAMEFMTSNKNLKSDYGLFVNIYSGVTPSSGELVVGSTTDKNWMSSPKIREKFKLNSKGNVIGFVAGGKYVVYQGRMSNERTSRQGGLRDRAIIERGVAPMMTVGDILNHSNINFSVDREVGVVYDYDLTYEGFTYDKLESLFNLN